MKSTVESLAATKRKITVEVPYEELKPALDKTYQDFGQQVSIPGFRRGHVPARIIDQRVGRGAIIQQAINDHLGDYYGQAVNDNGLIPLGQPEVEVTDLPNTKGPQGGDLRFTAEVEVLPEAEVPDMTDVTLEVDPVDVSDEEVDAELDRQRARFATLKKVDRPVQEGDFTSIDLTARVGEETVDSVSGVSYEVGSGSMLEGMDEALTGMSAGDTKTFTSTLRGGEHAGEDSQVEITLKAVKERELPALDDDFVQESSEFDTVDELRADARKNVASNKGAEQAVQARDKLMGVLRERMEMPVPEGLLKAELETHDEDELDDEKRQQITDSIRDHLLLERIAAELKPQIGQRELFDYVMQMARSYGMEPAQLLRDQNRIGMLAGELTRNKSLAKLLSQVKVKDTNGEDVDLSRFTRDPYAEAEAEAAAQSAAEQTQQDEGEQGEGEQA